MLEHANFLESVALWLHHDMVQTIYNTLPGTNTAKAVNLLQGTFGINLPARDDEDDKNDDDEEEVEPVIGREEEQHAEMGTTTHTAAQSADVVATPK